MTKGIAIDKEIPVELSALRKIKRDYERLKMEHELLKKATEFTSQQKATSSPLSQRTKKPSH